MASQQILLFANSANFGQLASPQSVHLERLAGTTPLARVSELPLFCPVASAPVFLHVGGELGREKYVVRFSDQGQMITHWSRAAEAVFAKSWLVRCSRCFSSLVSSLLSCPFLVFTFTVSSSCLGKGKGSPRGRRRWIHCPLYRLCTKTWSSPGSKYGNCHL